MASSKWTWCVLTTHPPCFAHGLQRDPLVHNVVRRIKAQHRLKAVWALAAKRTICETDSLEEDNEGGDATAEDQYMREQGETAKPKGQGGCGHEQPVWRKEGLKLIAVVKPAAVEKGEVRDKSARRSCLDVFVGTR